MQNEPTGKLNRMGQQALIGWRSRVGEPVAMQVSRLTRVRPDTARALIGAAFFLASLVYVIKTVTAAVRDGWR